MKSFKSLFLGLALLFVASLSHAAYQQVYKVIPDTITWLYEWRYVGRLSAGVSTTTVNAWIDSNGDMYGLRNRLQLGTTINEFSIDGALGDDSDNAIPTERAVKTYVDNTVLGLISISTLTVPYNCYLATHTNNLIGIGHINPQHKVDIIGSTTSLYMVGFGTSTNHHIHITTTGYIDFDTGGIEFTDGTVLVSTTDVGNVYNELAEVIRGTWTFESSTTFKSSVTFQSELKLEGTMDFGTMIVGYFDAIANVVHNTWTDATYTETLDLYSEFNGTTWTVTDDGQYFINAFNNWDNDSSGQRGLRIVKDSVVLSTQWEAAGEFAGSRLVYTLTATAGEEYMFEVYQDSGGNLNAQGGVAESNFSIRRLR